jgi:hypothetical protein
MLPFDMKVSQRDAEYIVQCLQQVLQQHESNAEKTQLSLDNDGISDQAIDVFCGFLHESSSPPCRLRSLCLWQWPPQQVRCLLQALHTNRSVKHLTIGFLEDKEGALWIADLLRHKKDFYKYIYSRLSLFVYANSPFAAWDSRT